MNPKAFQKYTYYAAAARKAGMNEIADYFEETAHNESAHAKVWFKALHGGDISTDIEANLRDAAAGENYEHTTMYKDFADEAEKKASLLSLSKCAKLVKSKLVMKLVTLH